MKATAARPTCARAPEPALWQSIPLELAFSTVLVLLAAALKLAGVLA